MGWTQVYGSTLKSTIADRTKGWETTSSNKEYYIKTVCIAHCFRGARTHKGILWSVFEQTFTKLSDGSIEVKRFIACDLLEYWRRDGYSGWSYKDMDESCHPYYYNCPEKYLKMVPEVASQEWREGVAEYHAKRRAKLAAKRAVLV